MKYSLFVAALLTIFLLGCGKSELDAKPPSLYTDDEGNRLGAPAGQE